MILVIIIINHTIHTLYERKFQEFCVKPKSDYNYEFNKNGMILLYFKN
jgi:hypothetical protein